MYEPGSREKVSAGGLHASRRRSSPQVAKNGLQSAAHAVPQPVQTHPLSSIERDLLVFQREEQHGDDLKGEKVSSGRRGRRRGYARHGSLESIAARDDDEG